MPYLSGKSGAQLANAKLGWHTIGGRPSSSDKWYKGTAMLFGMDWTKKKIMYLRESVYV